jgi:hypothetical protein
VTWETSLTKKHDEQRNPNNRRKVNFLPTGKQCVLARQKVKPCFLCNEILAGHKPHLCRKIPFGLYGFRRGAQRAPTTGWMGGVAFFADRTGTRPQAVGLPYRRFRHKRRASGRSVFSLLNPRLAKFVMMRRDLAWVFLFS